MMDLTKMPLVTLAEMANEAAEACATSARRTVEQAATCGRALLAAKDQCEHGQWMHWLRQNFDYDTSTARRYMDVAKCASVHNLADYSSVASVLRVLADERAAERATAQPEPEPEPEPQPGPAAEQWTPPADMPPEEPPAAPQTIVDHNATREPQEAQSEPQRAAQRAEPIEPEIVRDVTVQVFGRAFKLRVGRLYILTPEGFDEVDE
jgi:hypothetical protein